MHSRHHLIRVPTNPGNTSMFAALLEPNATIYVLVRQVSLVIEGSGIAEVARRPRLRDKAQSLPEEEGPHGSACPILLVFLIRLFAVDVEPHTGANVLRYCAGRDLFGFNL